MALLEKEAIRFAESLNDYEHVSVTDIGGWGPHGFWLVVRDHRFGCDYEISSHFDYWEFLSYFTCGLMWPVKPYPRGEVA